MSDAISTDVRWTSELERYFKTAGERNQCYGIMHGHAEKLYEQRKTHLELPIIVLSAVTGFLSVGSAQIFDGWAYSPIVLGVASLFVSVLNTTGSYFGFAKRQEGHRIASIHYAKAYRFLLVEMSLPREERMTAHDLLKKVKDDYDRLAEVSPPLPSESIAFFNTKYEKYSVAKPEEANGLTEIRVFEEVRPASVVMTPAPRSSDGDTQLASPQ
jgi:hypothetical protein